MRSTDALVGVLFMSTATLYWVTEVRTPRHVSRVPTVGQGRGLEEGSHLHTDSDIDAALRRHGGVAPPPPASELVHIKEVVNGDTTFEETIKHHRVRPTPLLIPIRKLDKSGLTCPGCRHPHSPLQRTSLWITPHLNITAITPPATLVILNMSLPRAWKAGWSSSSCPLSLLSATRCPLALRRSREGGRKGERGREGERWRKKERICFSALSRQHPQKTHATNHASPGQFMVLKLRIRTLSAVFNHPLTPAP